jgi:hypothetical protein
VAEEAIQGQQVRQVVAVAVVAQQEFYSTILYCLLLAVVAVAEAAVDSVLGSRLLGRAARPMPVYIQVKMVKITLATVVAAVAAVAAGLGVTVAQLGLVIPAL